MDRTDSDNYRAKNYSDFQLTLNSVGPIIKKAREEKNISLDSLAESLKINRGYLQSIENGSYESLPEIIYVKAMIRRISEKLSIDIDLRQFSSQGIKSKKIDLQKEKKEKVAKEEKGEKKQKKEKLIKNKMAYILIPIFAFLALFLGMLTTKIVLKFILETNQKNSETIAPKTLKTLS